jgi:hypothetical protein
MRLICLKSVALCHPGVGRFSSSRVPESGAGTQGLAAMGLRACLRTCRR